MFIIQIMRTLLMAIFTLIPGFMLAQSKPPGTGCDVATLATESAMVVEPENDKDEKYRRPPMVSYEINEDGSTTKVKLARSSGVKNVDQQLLAAVSNWKYEPRTGCGAMKVSLAAGSIPDADTAIKVAEPEMILVYGEQTIKSERPLNARLSGETWIVTGTLHCRDDKGHETAFCFGGVAAVHIAKSDGRILTIFHTK